jgi:hypothetical protein
MSTFQQHDPHLDLHAVERLEEVQHELQSQYDSRQYMNAQQQRAWEREVAGDVLLLREIFRKSDR